MNHSLAWLKVQIDASDPACALVRVHLSPGFASDSLEIRGRLMGPSCLYAETIEVAYPFVREGALTVVARIPEANRWHPLTPFLYAGPLEVWQAGQLLERRTLRLGLRTLASDRAGLRVNGQVLALRVQRVQSLNEEQARGLRAQGVNVLVAPPEPDLFELADRVGFFVVCETDAATLAAFAQHPSCLGWLDPHAATAGASPVELPGLRVIGA
jgi:hypothetical protein